MALLSKEIEVARSRFILCVKSGAILLKPHLNHVYSIQFLSSLTVTEASSSFSFLPAWHTELSPSEDAPEVLARHIDILVPTS